MAETKELTEKIIHIWGVGLPTIQKRILLLYLKKSKGIPSEERYKHIANNLGLRIPKIGKYKRLAENRVQQAYLKCPHKQTVKRYPLKWPLELLSIDQQTINVLHDHRPAINLVEDFFIQNITKSDLQSLEKLSGHRLAKLNSELSRLEFRLAITSPNTPIYRYLDKEVRSTLTSYENEFLADCYFGKVPKKVAAQEMSDTDRSLIFTEQDVTNLISSGLDKLRP